jgi:biopolymer transport protein ExbD
MGGRYDIHRRLIRHAARMAGGSLFERLQEEWLADLSEQTSGMSRLRFLIGCYWASLVISHEGLMPSMPVTRRTTEAPIMTVCVQRATPLLLRETSPSGAGDVLCSINTTPLIDVMLVLLITLILSLPIMTHAVKIDLPQAPPSDVTPPEVIDLDIDFDGTMVWDGNVVSSMKQLDGYFRAEAQKSSQPEIHLRPDSHAKYDTVAKVLAMAQRDGLKKVGFVNTAEFNH